MRFLGRQHGERDGGNARPLEAAVVARWHAGRAHAGNGVAGADTVHVGGQGVRSGEIAGPVQQRVPVGHDVHVDHHGAGLRIERLHVRLRSEQPELLHIEEDDVHDSLQVRVPEGLGCP